MKARILPFEPLFKSAYLAFARAAFGVYSYQSSPVYLDWLYAENPSVSKRPEDFLIVATESDSVVGCMHKLRQPWFIHGEIHDVPAMHNHFVEAEYRHGTGLQLMLKSLTHEYGVIAPGCEDKVGEIYRKLRRYTQISGAWYRKVLRPMSTAIHYGIEKWRSQPAIVTDIGFPSSSPNETRFLSRPDDELIHRLIDSYEARTTGFHVKQWYTPAFIKWRFFCENGPRHALVVRDGQDGHLDFAIVSIGRHRGVRLARIVEAVFAPPGFPELYRSIRALLSQNRVDIMTIFTVDPIFQAALNAQGLAPMADPPQTFVYFSEPVVLGSLRLNGASGDFGLDAIPRFL
ncbi:hypothetical protein EBR96_01565 [bacterium]|nr:hypothetical protein [bacterium]